MCKKLGCHLLSRANTEVLIHAFVSSRTDYCNALLSGLPKKSISNLQSLQNSAARVPDEDQRAGSHYILKSLHCLPVHFRIKFKVLLLVFKCLSGLEPSYLSDLFLPYEPSWTLRSSGTGLLIVPNVRTKPTMRPRFITTAHVCKALCAAFLCMKSAT